MPGCPNFIPHLHASRGLALFTVLLPFDQGESERLPAKPAASEGTVIGYIFVDTEDLEVLQVSGVGPAELADNAAVGTAGLAAHSVEDGAAEHQVRALKALEAVDLPSVQRV